MSSQRRLFGITSSVSQPSHGIVCGRVEAREKFHRRCDLPEGAEQTISGGFRQFCNTLSGEDLRAVGICLRPSLWAGLAGETGASGKRLRNVQKIRCKLCMFGRRGVQTLRPSPGH